MTYDSETAVAPCCARQAHAPTFKASIDRCIRCGVGPPYVRTTLY